MKESINHNFVPRSERLPEPCVPVIGQSDRWVHDDYNSKGFRECFRQDEGTWISAEWNNTHDCYDTIEDEGPELWQHYPSENEAPVVSTASDATMQAEFRVEFRILLKAAIAGGELSETDVDYIIGLAESAFLEASDATGHTGWLIEKGSVASPKYLTVSTTRWDWTYEHILAIRFARKVDAITVAQHFLLRDTEGLRICEHAWNESALREAGETPVSPSDSVKVSGQMEWLRDCYTHLKGCYDTQRRALKRAVETIQVWDGMGMSEEAAKQSWECYQSSPEMKEINAALELPFVPAAPESDKALFDVSTKFHSAVEKTLNWMNANDYCDEHREEDEEGWNAMSYWLLRHQLELDKVRGVTSDPSVSEALLNYDVPSDHHASKSSAASGVSPQETMEGYAPIQKVSPLPGAEEWTVFNNGAEVDGVILGSVMLPNGHSIGMLSLAACKVICDTHNASLASLRQELESLQAEIIERDAALLQRGYQAADNYKSSEHCLRRAREMFFERNPPST